MFQLIPCEHETTRLHSYGVMKTLWRVHGVPMGTPWAPHEHERFVGTPWAFHELPMSPAVSPMDSNVASIRKNLHEKSHRTSPWGAHHEAIHGWSMSVARDLVIRCPWASYQVLITPMWATHEYPWASHEVPMRMSHDASELPD